MPSLGNALQELRKDRSATQLRLEKLNQIISGIESLNGAGTTGGGKPSEADYIRSFTAKDGAGAESAMGEDAGTFAVNSGGKDDQFRSGKAHHISSGQKENRSRSAG